MQAYIGIDFGTSNSSIAYVMADPRNRTAQKVDVKPVRVAMDEDGGARAERVPTIIAGALDRRRRTPLLGWEFFTQFSQRRRKAQLLRHGETFFRSVKSDLGSYRVYPHASWAEFNTPEKVAGAIMERLLKEARQVLIGYDLFKSHVVISVPASLNALGREHTLEAARLAGLDTDLIELIDEPVAALLDFLNDGRAASVLDGNKPKNILVFDYGGGTLDLSLVRASFDSKNTQTGLRVENLAISQYRRLGGDDIDRAIMQEVVWPQIEAACGIKAGALSRSLRQDVEDTLTPTVARRLKEGICRKFQATRDQRGGKKSRKLESIEPLVVTFEDIELPHQFRITDDEFVGIMRPFLAPPDSDRQGEGSCSLLVPVLEVLNRGGVDLWSLDALVLHGGSCRNPLVREMLAESFSGTDSLFKNAVILETPDLDASVAQGAALSAYWRHECKVDIVTPIIAEEIGILTLDDKPQKLLASGTQVPFPDEDGVYEVPVAFYVPTPNLRQMLVPFYSGERAQSVTASVHLELPPGVQRGACVRIKLRVDRNKTLQWWYNVNGGAFFAARALNDPWSAYVPSKADRELLELRRQMREMLAETGKITAEMECAEASRMYRIGRLDEAELLLHDCQRHNGLKSGVANLLGLIYSRRGDRQKALEWHRKAADMEPGNAVLVGNYGYILADQGKSEEAESKMRQALGVDPDLRYLYERLGDLYRKRGDENGARKEYQEALRLARRNALGEQSSSEAWWAVAGIHQKLGEYPQAAEARSKAHHLSRNEWLGGDHRHRIAGPDSGVITSDVVLDKDDPT